MSELLAGRALDEVRERIVGCRRCPRLVAWREAVAEADPDRSYWARPVPGFGDPQARLLVLGMATAARGGNRTGRAFTGNASADWLMATLYRAGLASQPTSEFHGDGLGMHGVWLASAVRCPPPQNRPTAAERDACLAHLRAELDCLRDVRAVLTLGTFAWAACARLLGIRPIPRFGHGIQHAGSDGPTMLASYHPSRQNTNTGVLTAEMLDDVVARAAALAGLTAARDAPRPAPRGRAR